MPEISRFFGIVIRCSHECRLPPEAHEFASQSGDTGASAVGTDRGAQSMTLDRTGSRCSRQGLRSIPIGSQKVIPDIRLESLVADSGWRVEVRFMVAASVPAANVGRFALRLSGACGLALALVACRGRIHLRPGLPPPRLRRRVSSS